VTIAEVEQLVASGAIDPDAIHTAGIFVDRIFQGVSYEKRVEFRMTAGQPPSTDGSFRDALARRAAQELRDGDYVNLGIGIPTLVANYVPPGVRVTFQSENGLLGVGPFPEEAAVDPDLINAGKQTVSALPGASCFSSADSFGMIRGGHIDLAILGALEVSRYGDIANWMVPGKMVKGPGGAMDLVNGAKRVIAVLEHTAKDGTSKIVPECALPLTGRKAVDLIITNLAVFEVSGSAGLTLREIMAGASLEEVTAKTLAPFRVSDTLKGVS
jgi:3-oxoacid CoA-transferase